MRLTVNAVCVTTGELASFDSSRQRVGIEHVLASSALPPGFPPVRIDGRLYWDGGLYSNTPMEIVLDEEPRQNTLCFMVDLWRAEGPEPQTLEAVRTRHKDVLYASRSRRHIEEFRRMHDLRHALHALRQELPPKLRDSDHMRTLTAHACHTVMHIVHLPYGGHDWYMASKDINFSSGSIEWRWQQGYNDASRAAELAPWLAPQPSHIGVVVHELPPKESGENPTGAHSDEGERHHENAA
jgi:NTE family protein